MLAGTCNAHTHEIFQSFELLHIDNMYKSHVGKYMFRQMHHMLPESLLQNYSQNELIHSYHTRQASDIHREYSRTRRVANSFLYFGPIYWSSLPAEIKNVNNEVQFKRCHKQYLLQSPMSS